MIEGGENLNDETYSGELHDEFGRVFDPFTGELVLGFFPPDFSGMGIHNPQPGSRYYYAVNPDRDGGSNTTHLSNKYGAEFVRPDDPEYIGSADRGNLSKTQNGSVVGYGDVVVMRIDQETYDKVKRREHEEHLNALDGVVAEFKDRDPYSNGKPTRFVREEHGVTVEDLKGS